MKTLTRLALVFALVIPSLVGCATKTVSTTAAPGNTFTGEVWTWDEKENTVTLRRSGEIIRVKTTPDQIKGLQLHSNATIRGELAPPAEIPRVMTPAVPMTAVPKGPVDQQTVSGTVTAVDPTGRLSIDSERGPMHVWTAAGANQRFAVGDKVQVMIAVQGVDMVPASSGSAPATPDPSASLTSQPGDSAVVTGRIMGVDRGLIVVESPSGPIQVWVGESARYSPSQSVQVRTNVSKAQ
ncbi:MAG TPA: hypothetical protein VGT02_09425 [Methylomirabilota bacterium]|jgi:hypothetical protein|nr:hypothetical protein [Methylomirabilota bacterium]